MASVLVDPDDILYIDEVDDEDDISEGGSDKRQKKRKNRIIHEALSVNSNEPMVKELRQDRQRLLSEKEEVNKDIETPSAISMLHELRKDRKQALEEQRANQQVDTLDGLNASKQSTDEQTYALISEPLESETFETSEQNTEVAVVSDTNMLLKHYSRVDKRVQKNAEPLQTESKFEHGNTSKHVFESEHQQIEEDFKQLQATIQKTSSRKSPKTAQHNEVSNEDDLSQLDGSEQAICQEEIVRPKVITEAQILMTEEPSTSGTSLDEIQTSSQNMLKKKKSGHGEHESKTHNKEASGIQIIVTKPQDGSENGSIKKSNGNVHGKGRRKKNDDSDKSNNLAETPDDESSGLSGMASLNYLRRLSSPGGKSEGAANDLLIKRALYEQRKAKPFKRLAKLKSGQIEVGIEGDMKRSYIKAMTMMPDKKLVMFDRNNQCLKLFDSDFNPLDRVSVPVKFCGLAPVFDETLVVSFPEKKQLQLYRIDQASNSFQRDRTQTTLGEYYAIAHFKIKLYMLQRQQSHDRFSDDQWSILEMDLNGGDTEPVVLRRFSPGHKDNDIYVNVEGVYLTNKLEGEILLMAHDGTYKQKCSVDMSLPMCITSDLQGNIYVCGGSISSFIEVFKPDLQGSKVIFNKKAQDLVAICYDQQSNYLYASDKIAGKVLRYKIEHNGLMHGLMRAIVAGSGISC